MKVTLDLDGHTHEVTLDEGDDGRWTAEVDGHTYRVHVHRDGPGTVVSIDGTMHIFDEISTQTARIDGNLAPYRIRSLQGVAGAADSTAGVYGPIRPPMTGKLDKILVTVGQEVAAGDVLFVLEAMKMRNEIKAAADGTIAAIHAKEGDAVDGRIAVLDLAPPDP